MAIDWSSRTRAAGVHLACSVAMAALAAALVFTLWYPWPYSIVSGGTELFALLVSVDTALGPAITFAVFDRRKPTTLLRRDLFVVVLLQLAALGYGLHTTFVARPVVLALEGDRFRATSAVDVRASELPEALPAFRRLSLDGPRTVRAIVPTEGDEKFDAITLGLAGTDVGMRPKLWRDWDDLARKEALAAAKPLTSLLKRQRAISPDAKWAIERSGLPFEAMVYLPLVARRTDWVVLLDSRDGSIAGFVPLDGF